MNDLAKVSRYTVGYREVAHPGPKLGGALRDEIFVEI